MPNKEDETLDAKSGKRSARREKVVNPPKEGDWTSFAEKLEELNERLKVKDAPELKAMEIVSGGLKALAKSRPLGDVSEASADTDSERSVESLQVRRFEPDNQTKSEISRLLDEIETAIETMLEPRNLH